MRESSIILIIASFFIFLFAVGNQISRITNDDMKKLLGKITDAHLLTSGLFDEIPFAIIGIVCASFYTLFKICILCIQGKIGFFIKTILKEKEFLKHFFFYSFIWLIGTLLAFYEKIFEYIILVFAILGLVTMKAVLEKIRSSYK